MKPYTVISCLIALLLSLASSPQAFAAKTGWKTDYHVTLKQAEMSSKLVLLDFTGSDWCPACMMLDREFFSTSEFSSLAAKSLLLVEIDFPKIRPLPASVSAQNEKLKDRYGVNSFPTLILTDSSGKEIKRWVGYGPGLMEQMKSAIKSSRVEDGESFFDATHNKVLSGMIVLIIGALFLKK